MGSLERYTVIVSFILSTMFASAKQQCGNMSCDFKNERNGGPDECHLFYLYEGIWFYESRIGIRQGIANIGDSKSCYKYVVKRRSMATSCIEMEKHCIESGGAPAVIDSYQEYGNINEFILDVTRVESFKPEYRKLLVQVGSLPMIGFTKSCSQLVVKDGLLADNEGYLLTQSCAEKTIVNSVLCEYSNTIKAKEPICETSLPTTVSPSTGSKRTTTVAMGTPIANANMTTPTWSTMHPTDVASGKNIWLVATTVAIIGLLIIIIVLFTCMLLCIGKTKENRRQERYVVRAHHHQIRSVHLYDSPLDEWMDKPYFVESQQESLYSNVDPTNPSRPSEITPGGTDIDQYIASNPTTGDYENHCIYSSLCQEHPENKYVFSPQNQAEFKDYYNVGTTNLETLAANIVLKKMYNPLQVLPDIEPRANENNGESDKYNYDKLSRSAARSLMSMPNRYKPRTSNDHDRWHTAVYAPSGGKTDYHHLQRRCATIAIGSRSRGEHDYSRLTSDNTLT